MVFDNIMPLWGKWVRSNLYVLKKIMYSVHLYIFPIILFLQQNWVLIVFPHNQFFYVEEISK
jgi:hypothetical protein